jgi:preprotein translocase subunit SecE
MGVLTKVGKPFLAVGQFIRQVFAELAKVVTPSSRELAGWSFAVFVFVFLLMAFITAGDYGLGKLVMWIFG